MASPNEDDEVRWAIRQADLQNIKASPHSYTAALVKASVDIDVNAVLGISLPLIFSDYRDFALKVILGSELFGKINVTV